MKYEPQFEDVVDMFLTEHSETRIYRRFPSLRLRSNFTVFVHYCESEAGARPTWAIPIHGGFIIGEFEKSKTGSFIKGIFIAQTALHNWQFKRSKFRIRKTVKVQFRRINSQIQNKIKHGKECAAESIVALEHVTNIAAINQFGGQHAVEAGC